MPESGSERELNTEEEEEAKFKSGVYALSSVLCMALHAQVPLAQLASTDVP